MGRVLFRADGNGKMGLGHVYRSCALAEMLKANFECIFIIRDPLPALRDVILISCSAIIEIPADSTQSEEIRTLTANVLADDIIVLDGYHFDTGYQEKLKEILPNKLVCIDDTYDCTFLADIIINHSGGIHPRDYSAPSHCQYFLGFRFSLLRSIFLKGGSERNFDKKYLLLCLGGGDPENITLQVLKQVIDHGFDKITILAGAGYKHIDLLQQYINTQDHIIEVKQNADAVQVRKLMDENNYAVLSPSSIALEYLSVSGVLYLKQIADNQEHIKRFLLSEGLAIDLEDFRFPDAPDREKMLSVQHKYFDNRSGERLLQVFENIVLSNKTEVRRATDADVQLTYLWANDTLARAMSFNKEPIPFETHEKWFNKKLQEASCFYYILYTDKKPFAQIRFDKRAEDYLISYSIDEAFRGRSLGSFILAEGIKTLKATMQNGNTIIITGYVKKDNIASCISFERLRFKKEESNEYEESYKYTL